MTALLLLHGFTGSPRSWDFLPNQTTLPRQAPALVGHVGSGAGKEIVNFEDEVDRLATLIPAAASAHVVGYSLGARLALGVALLYPARVAQLTLISGHPGLSSDTERSARRSSDAVWCDLLLTRGLSAFVDAWQAQPLWASQSHLDDATLRQKRSERLSHDAAGLARSLRVTGLAEMPDYGARLSELRMPVTLVAGALDTKFCALAQGMAERLPHAVLKIVPQAGHDLLLERHEFVTDVIQTGNQS